MIYLDQNDGVGNGSETVAIANRFTGQYGVIDHSFDSWRWNIGFVLIILVLIGIIICVMEYRRRFTHHPSNAVDNSANIEQDTPPDYNTVIEIKRMEEHLPTYSEAVSLNS